VLKWPADAQHAALPHMQTDIILKQSTGRCILIDTKFTQVFCQGYYRKRDLLKSPHLYQLYTYLRSQEYQGSRFQFTQGMLIYPSLGQDVDINIQLQHYPVGFYTVDLSLDRMQIEQQLLAFITASTHIDYDHIS
jgi:5-methylcytosine-specific restriction enzyme subunit McrC